MKLEQNKKECCSWAKYWSKNVLLPVLYLPKNMFRDESNPAAYILAERSFSSRLANIRQANLDIVDWELTYDS